MKQVITFRTMDGKLHGSQEEATKHTENIYGQKLHKIALAIVHLNGKFHLTQEWIDNNLELFEELISVKNDLTLENPVVDEERD